MNLKTQIIAFYLPQFHRIDENDKWWGEGFTEWTNTRKAKPIYDGHYQPREPKNDNYYDLSSVKEMYNQANIAKEHGVTGFCYYHYWFKGHKLLNKPLENMLSDKGVNIDFCLSWANEPWTRAWDGSEKEILIAQDYGVSSDWDRHISYLIPFFRDDRYIKVDGKPMFLIYRTESFSRFDEMIKYWNEKLISVGLNELYIVETLNSFQTKPSCQLSSAVLEFEPMFTIANDFSFFERVLRAFRRKYLDAGLFKVSYNQIWRRILRRNNEKNYGEKKLFSGGFVDWDSTPRKGNNGLVMTDGSPLLFKKYFRTLFNSKKSDFIFINAWNEWAEGTYLEPDKKYGYDYLKAVKEVYNDEEST